MHYSLHTFKNGFRVLLVPMPESRTATVAIMTGTGSRYEDARENGLAHFLEHMFFKGTKKRPGAKVISEELDSIGAVYNAFTAKDRTAYWAKVSGNYLETALDVLSDVFLNSTLPNKEITKERGTIIQEIDMYEDMPMRTVDTVFDELLYGAAHPLGRSILGPKENIRSFKRKDFLAYLKRNYTPLNTVAVIAGSFNEKSTLAKLRRNFGTLPHGNPPDYIRFSFGAHGPRVAVKQKNTDQTHFMLGVPAYPYLHKDEYALAVLATILGGGMSSRLFTEVREKRGLAYSVSAWVERYPDTGAFLVQAGVEHTKLDKTIATILSEFRKAKRATPPARELEKAKRYLKGIMTLSLETSDEIAMHAATSILSIGRVRPLSEILAGVDAVRASDVLRVARDILTTNTLHLAVIGPASEKGTLLQSLRV